MSLILRKECQYILDNYKLQNYHVLINQNTKYLQIVGECGQPLINISGIQFTRLTPTKLEIKYATELLNSFLTAHMSEITTYIAQKIANKKFPFIETTNDRYNITTNSASGMIYNSLVYTDGPVKIYIKSNTIGNPLVSIIDNSLTRLSEWKVNMDLLGEMRTTLYKFVEQRERDGVIQKLHAELSTCDI